MSWFFSCQSVNSQYIIKITKICFNFLKICFGGTIYKQFFWGNTRKLPSGVSRAHPKKIILEPLLEVTLSILKIIQNCTKRNKFSNLLYYIKLLFVFLGLWQRMDRALASCSQAISCSPSMKRTSALPLGTMSYSWCEAARSLWGWWSASRLLTTWVYNMSLLSVDWVRLRQLEWYCISQ